MAKRKDVPAWVTRVKDGGGRRMPLPENERKLAEETLNRYCAGKFPEHIKDKLWLAYRFRGNAVTLYECRPRYDDPLQRTEHDVAQFLYDAKTQAVDPFLCGPEQSLARLP
jgi:hypothetical protein